MADLQPLNLDLPGKLWASTEHEQTNTFYLVIPQDKYTADALSDNPAIDPPDMLMSPWSATASQADANGVITLDLAASGKVKEIQATFDRMFSDGQPLPSTVKAIVIATAADGNSIPAKQLAQVMEMQLTQLHEIALKGEPRGAVDPLYVTADAWKKGTVDFLVEMTVLGIDEVTLTTSNNGSDITVDGHGGPARSVTIDCKGQNNYSFHIHVGVQFTMSQETRAVYHPQITFAWDRWKPAYYTYDKRNIITGATFTLNVVGKSAGAPVNKSIQLQCEAWAANSDWMIDTSSGPPAVYCHPHC